MYIYYRYHIYYYILYDRCRYTSVIAVIYTVGKFIPLYTPHI